MAIVIEVRVFNENVTLPSLAQGTFLVTWDSLYFLSIDSKRIKKGTNKMMESSALESVLKPGSGQFLGVHHKDVSEEMCETR